MLDTFTLSRVASEGAVFFSHIDVPLFWIAGIVIAYGLGNWILAKVRNGKSRVPAR